MVREMKSLVRFTFGANENIGLTAIESADVNSPIFMLRTLIILTIYQHRKYTSISE